MTLIRDSSLPLPSQAEGVGSGVHQFASANAPKRLVPVISCSCALLSAVFDDGEQGCPQNKMRGFSSRYLEWLMIAKGKSEDQGFTLTVRGEKLNKKERMDVLLVSEATHRKGGGGG